MAKTQTKSKQRVADHGEVFTAEREVNAMLDLVKQETERIDSRFLEPACGDGNFLAEILRRKLAVVKSRYGKNPADYERYAVIAVTSIYGVDLLQDNVEECRNRMFQIFDSEYSEICKKDANNETLEAVRHILKHNILCGDALTLKTSNKEPIIFAEWSAINSYLIKRRDFRLDQMLEGHEEQLSLEMNDWEYDKEVKAFIPLPIREFPPIHYRKVQQYE
jgi:SAM-dependent methyltransferase